jgi:hypothetical protein
MRRTLVLAGVACILFWASLGRRRHRFRSSAQTVPRRGRRVDLVISGLGDFNRAFSALFDPITYDAVLSAARNAHALPRDSIRGGRLTPASSICSSLRCCRSSTPPSRSRSFSRLVVRRDRFGTSACAHQVVAGDAWSGPRRDRGLSITVTSSGTRFPSRPRIGFFTAGPAQPSCAGAAPAFEADGSRRRMSGLRNHEARQLAGAAVQDPAEPDASSTKKATALTQEDRFGRTARCRASGRTPTGASVQ